jgi:hypothetical protein
MPRYYIEIIGHNRSPNAVAIVRDGAEITDVHCHAVGDSATIMRAPNRRLVQAALFADEHLATEVAKAAIWNGQKFRVIEARGEIAKGGVLIDVRPQDFLVSRSQKIEVVKHPYRPRQDFAAIRVVKSYSIHPSTAERIASEAQITGESQGQVLDRYFASA